MIKGLPNLGPKVARVRAAIEPKAVRLAPAVMVTAAALFGLKAVAVAQDISGAAPAPQTDTASTAAATSTPEANAQAAAETCNQSNFADMAGLSQSEVQVLQALGARRESLDARATEMDTQTELLAAAQSRLDQRLAELRRLESTVNGLLGQLDEAQEQRLANLVDVYQRMRAKDAAAVFDGLDDGVLVQVASRMRQANLAEVMGKMNPVRARALTQQLAELSRPPADGADLLRRANAPGGAAPAPAPGR